MRDRVTLEEWCYACTQAIENQTHHKFPMPAVLLESVKEYRWLQREAAQTPPRIRQIRESLVSQEELRKLQASIWPEERARWAKDPIPPWEEDAP